MQSPRAGDQISIEPHEARPTLLEPQAIPLEILFEDDDLLVINKPEELVVHPGPGHEDGTIVNAVLHHCRGQLSGIGGVERPGIVHRLDLGTSGCLVIAKNDTAHLSLSEEFGGRIVEKTYQCIACGRVEPVRGEIRIPIGRHAVHRQKMAVTTTTRGKEAWTSFRVLEQMKHAAWV